MVTTTLTLYTCNASESVYGMFECVLQVMDGVWPSDPSILEIWPGYLHSNTMKIVPSTPPRTQIEEAKPYTLQSVMIRHGLLEYIIILVLMPSWRDGMKSLSGLECVNKLQN